MPVSIKITCVEMDNGDIGIPLPDDIISNMNITIGDIIILEVFDDTSMSIRKGDKVICF